MAMTETTGSILEMLEKYEQSIGKLYDIYAEAIPNHAAFWSALAKEERAHAVQLNRLLRSENRARHETLLSHIMPAAIGTSLDYVERQIAKAQTSPPANLVALSVAKDLENSIIEKGFFQMLQECPPDLKDVLELLKTETGQHYEKLQARWFEEKASKTSKDRA